MISQDDEDMLASLSMLADLTDDDPTRKFLTAVHGRLWELLDEKHGEPLPQPKVLEPVNLSDFDDVHTWGRA